MIYFSFLLIDFWLRFLQFLRSLLWRNCFCVVLIMNQLPIYFSCYCLASFYRQPKLKESSKNKFVKWTTHTRFISIYICENVSSKTPQEDKYNYSAIFDVEYNLHLNQSDLCLNLFVFIPMKVGWSLTIICFSSRRPNTPLCPETPPIVRKTQGQVTATYPLQ